MRTTYTIIYKWCANKDEKIYSQHKANKYKRENQNEDIKRDSNNNTNNNGSTKMKKKSTAKMSNGEAERIHQSQFVCERTWKF